MSLSFAQQGSLDWAALGRMQFSASIALLSRLSSAGIEPLTVAFGQAMCSRVCIGAHGEKVLMESLNNLKAFSSFGDLIWFGVGVRHVLRDIVQSSEGASLVALCAAMSETFSIQTSALILYEMSKLVRASRDLSPSLAQWEAFVKASSCIFSETTFSLNVQTLLGLAGHSNTKVQDWYHQGHPQDLAEILLVLGQITRGEIERITVRGGPTCCWLAVYSSFILGLRVEVNSNMAPLMKNYDERTVDSQLCLNLVDDTETSRALDHVATSFVVRDGHDFIQQIFNGYGKDMPETTNVPFLGGSLSWDSLFYDCFGQDVTALLNQLYSPHENTKHETFVAPFRKLYTLGILLYTTHLDEISRFQSIPAYILFVTDKLAELRPFYILSRQTMTQDGRRTLTDIASEYEETAKNLKALCECFDCRAASTSFNLHSSNYRKFCWLSVAETMLVLTYLVGRCEFKSEIRPKMLGMMLFYQTINERRNHGPKLNADMLLSHLTMEGFQSSPSFLFSSIMTLFTGSPSRILFSVDYPSAHSNGGLYCYLNSLSDLSLDYAANSKLCVGSGSIEYRSRVHDWIFDKRASTDRVDLNYPPQRFTKTRDLSVLNTDTSSSSLLLEGVVEDDFHLVFYYRLSSTTGKRFISPASFVNRCLQPMTALKARSMLSNLPKSQWEPILNDSVHIVAHGEGKLLVHEAGLILRPHKDNTLGQCIALSWYPGQSALVTNDSELDAFIGWYAKEAKQNIAKGAAPPPYFVISG
ncbi:hypothetical protein PEX2_038310 [Penicillium expansum]|uniref:Uncharacterized protein n=1 Tax=Penicillium expansum TaxID=27334 RepID=A0A0A2IS85_PENEN|nr:hypothetical protein PEX2_038310 [Penicillium expansum]KGO45929.1 hypothetical protein PEXP_018090 [Penicillium expansum]KGO54343.1 hypothetical protein PEX2_038310 [Penicillium expansum]